MRPEIIFDVDNFKGEGCLHNLRHTFASIAASKGLSLPIIGALLGHKQTQTTARYAHLIGQPLLEASEKISGEIIRRKKEQPMTNNIISQDYTTFLEDLKGRVASSRYKAALSVNKEMILLYHHMGTEILKSQERHG